MIYRCEDAKLINEIINDPEVFDKIAPFGVESWDISEELKGNNIFLMDKENNGGQYFRWKDFGLYEVHTIFKNGTSPRVVLETIQKCLKWIFTKTDAIEIISFAPVINVEAVKLGRRFGNLFYKREKVWKNQTGVECDVEYYRLTIDDWIKDSDLKSEMKEFESDEKFVGFVIECAKNEQLVKGLAVYNRFAVKVGWEKLFLISKQPVIFSIKDFIIIFDKKGNPRGLKCL